MKCPPRRNTPPLRRPAMPEGCIVLQPNRNFEDVSEMNEYLKNEFPNLLRVHKTWLVEVLRCEIVIPEPKAKYVTKSKKK
jgi:hypothetical protein